MHEFIGFLALVIDLYIWVIIISVIMSWLMAFGVVNPHNPFVRQVWQAVNALTEPLLGPIRRLLPNLSGLDISPIILWLALIFVKEVVLVNLDKAFR
jgi:YggT family protein